MSTPADIATFSRAVRSVQAASEGQLTTLKWIGVAAMLVDHVGRYGFGLGMDSWAFAVGRVAYPIFAGVLGVHLARYGTDPGKAWRTARRLAVWALVSILPAWLARGDWLPLNVFATLALGASCCATSSLRNGYARAAGVSALLAAGAVVEFSVPGVVVVWSAYRWCSVPGSQWADAGLLGAVTLLLLLNGTFGGPAAVVGTLAGATLFGSAAALPKSGQRQKWAFYCLYPVHLLVIGFATRPFG